MTNRKVRGRRKRRGRPAGTDSAARLKWLLLFGLTLLLFVSIASFVRSTVRPTLVAAGQLRAQTMIAETVNDAVREKFLEDESAAVLLEVLTDGAGEPVLVRADTAAMNRLSADLSHRILNKLENLEPQRQQVPLGAILGSQIWSQTNVFMNVRVQPLGTAKIGFETEFEAVGINQTKYKVYLEVETRARLLAPFSREELTAENELLIAETIIVGDVPSTYVKVPEEDVLEMVQ
ncbi:MAG: sporulation protein YunB [Firmicutes bacterium]|nr:sporulation protein YunB [Bacillota bacterium]